LKIFHQFNFTFSSPLDWQALLDDVRSADQSDLLQQIEEMANDFAKALDSYRHNNNNHRTHPPDRHNEDDPMEGE